MKNKKWFLFLMLVILYFFQKLKKTHFNNFIVCKNNSLFIIFIILLKMQITHLFLLISMFLLMSSTACIVFNRRSGPACPIRVCYLKYSFTSLGLMSLFSGCLAGPVGAATVGVAISEMRSF